MIIALMRLSTSTDKRSPQRSRSCNQSISNSFTL